MKFLLKLFKGPIKKIVIRELKKEATHDLIVATLNEKLDIPKLTEDEEATLLSTVLNAAIDATTVALDRL